METPLPPIPRKLSINSAFPRYAMNLIKISVDGKPQRLVLEYDQDEGRLERYAVGDNGLIQLAPDGEHIVQETIRGKVTVEYDEEKARVAR